MIISLRVFQNILKRLRTDFGSENQIVLVQSELVKRFSSLLQNEFVIQEDTIYFDALILAYSLTIFSSANDSIITNNKNIFCLYCKVTKFSYLKEYNFELIMCDRR